MGKQHIKYNLAPRDCEPNPGNKNSIPGIVILTTGKPLWVPVIPFPGPFLPLPVLAPAIFLQLAKWDLNVKLIDWIKCRVLELVYTSWDLQDFARDCGYEGEPFKWDDERRFLLRCELDAAYFLLYGISEEDVDYIMETFPIVKRKDLATYGTFRTKDKILEIYQKLKEPQLKK